MDSNLAPELEELTLCSFCKQRYNDGEMCPKLLSCKHYFCLQCMRTSLMKGQGELYCVHCWKRTELGDLGPEALPTYAPVLSLSKSFAQLKLGGKPPEKAGGAAGGGAAGGGGPGGKVISENCHTHAMPLALWCGSCAAAVCRACATTAEHASHQVKSQAEAKEQLAAEIGLELASMGKTLGDVQRLAVQQRDFLLKVLEACVTLKAHVEADLAGGMAYLELAEAREQLGKARQRLAAAEHPADMHQLHQQLQLDKQRLQARHHEMYLQCQLDDLIRNSTVAFDFALLKQALLNVHSGELPPPGGSRLLTPPPQQNPILFLANYCMSQLYSRHVLSKQQQQQQQQHHHHQQQQQQHHHQQQQQQHLHNGNGTADQQQQQLQQQQAVPPHLLAPPHLVLASPKGGGGGGGGGGAYADGPPSALTVVSGVVHSPQGLVRNPSNPYPLYYFNIDVNGAPHGRIVIEVRPDVAPKMSKNFGILATGDLGMGYKGCSIFQCWEGESVITGDFELNNGRGGRSIFEDGYFMPDDTKLLAVRGTVGMRRTQKRHDNLGMVGSQFRIILQEMRGFTGIFGHVVEGLELVEKLSTYGDSSGKPTKTILITKCGKL